MAEQLFRRAGGGGGSSTEFHPDPGVGHELGVMFGFLGSFIIGLYIHRVCPDLFNLHDALGSFLFWWWWTWNQKKEDRRERERVEAIRSSGWDPRQSIKERTEIGNGKSIDLE